MFPRGIRREKWDWGLGCLWCLSMHTQIICTCVYIYTYVCVWCIYDTLYAYACSPSTAYSNKYCYACMHAYPIPYTLYLIPYTLYPIPYTVPYTLYHIPTIHTVPYHSVPYRATSHTREGIDMFAFNWSHCKMLTCPLTKHTCIHSVKVRLLPAVASCCQLLPAVPAWPCSCSQSGNGWNGCRQLHGPQHRDARLEL